MGERKLYGYYYGFDATGVEEVDAILEAVGTAGKAYHLTEDWCEPLSSDFRNLKEGESCAEGIQRVASEGAALLLKIHAEHAEMLDLIETWHLGGMFHVASCMHGACLSPCAQKEVGDLIARIEWKACKAGHVEYVDECEHCQRIPWQCPKCGKTGVGLGVHTCYVKGGSDAKA